MIPVYYIRLLPSNPRPQVRATTYTAPKKLHSQLLLSFALRVQGLRFCWPLHKYGTPKPREFPHVWVME